MLVLGWLNHLTRCLNYILLDLLLTRMEILTHGHLIELSLNLIDLVLNSWHTTLFPFMLYKTSYGQRPIGGLQRHKITVQLSMFLFVHLNISISVELLPLSRRRENPVLIGSVICVRSMINVVFIFRLRSIPQVLV